MSIGKRVLAAAAGLTLAAGAAIGATSAFASTAGCSFGDGCATLHGVNAAGNPVAMDAKYKNKNEILIGYPDNAGDGATSFDGVLHFGKGPKVTTYADTGLAVSHFLTQTCKSGGTADVAPSVTNSGTGSGTITAVSGGTNNDLSVDINTATDLDIAPASGPAATLDWSAVATSGSETLTVTEDYGVGCVALWSDTVGFSSGPHAHFGPWTASSPAAGGLISETNTGSSVDTFTDSVPGGTFSFTALPAGIAPVTPPGADSGTLTADTSTAVPGLYTSLGVIYTEPDGAVDTASFDLLVTGIKTTTPGPGVPYYTFVYAPNGTWTNQCVTDESGSGGLKLVACTGGDDRYQDFFALDGAGAPAQISDGVTEYHFQDWLAQASDPGSSCLTDPSTLDPATPQTDATDEGFNGRQLRVDGSCTTTADLWNWNT
jgi:hypothetical protein